MSTSTLTDTHCHLQFPEYRNDFEHVIKRIKKRGMLIINVGTDFKMSKEGLEIADKYANIYSTVGIHPADVNEATRLEIESLEKLAQNKKVVAIGETGLDYFRLSRNVARDFSPAKKTKNLQKEIFLKHIEVASMLNLPLVLHCRAHDQDDAYRDMLEILEKERQTLPKRGVVHCFSSNSSIAQKFISLGFYISFTGIITFKNADNNILEAVKNMPIDNLLIETDAPFLAPEPFRGQRNEPIYVEYVARKIAEIKGMNYDDVERITFENAIKLFNLKI